jgi:hypothetical protein
LCRIPSKPQLIVMDLVTGSNICAGKLCDLEDWKIYTSFVDVSVGKSHINCKNKWLIAYVLNLN